MSNWAAQNDYDETEGSPRFWHGMIAFATCMLVLLGAFHIIGGFVALFEEDVYAVPARDLVVEVDYNAWGLAHMALGVGMLLAAYALFWGKTWGRVVAIVVAMVSAISNLAFLPAAPVWYGLMILLNILVVYAVTVHGGRNREY
jgi:hypothetical protein